MTPSRPPVHLAPEESTKPELEQEKRLRAELTRRTDKLSDLLDDYRRQDNILRRR